MPATVQLVCCILLNYRENFNSCAQGPGSWDSAAWSHPGGCLISVGANGSLRTKFVLLALGFWLVGCQSTGKSDSGRYVPGSGDFETLGKLALRGPNESLSVRFRWQQTGESYDLELWGPFGQGRTRLVGDTEQMAVLDGQGQVLSQGLPAVVVRQQIGWDLPLLALVSWAQGKPTSGARVSEVSRDDQGRYASFAQENWKIQYLAYYEPKVDTSEVPSEALQDSRPKTIALTTGDYRLKVAFNRWQP